MHKIILFKKANLLCFLIITLNSLFCFSQELISNFDFNGVSAYPISPIPATVNVGSTCTSIEPFGINSSGVSTGTLAFIQNSIAGDAIKMANSSGSNKYFEFEITGSYLRYFKSHKIYFQSLRSATGSDNIIHSQGRLSLIK